MSSFKLWPRIVMILVGLELWCGHAGADDVDPARQYFEQASHAFSEGRYREAIDLFRLADRAAPRAELQYNIGVACEEMGDVAGALEAYRAYLRRAPKSADRGVVEKYVARLEQQLAKRGVQQISVRTEPSGATLFVDGVPVGISPWTGELSQGRHQLVTEVWGYRQTETALDVSLEHASDVEVQLFPVVSLPPQSQATVRVCNSNDSRKTGFAAIEPVTWTLLGVGALSLAGAGYFDLSRAQAADAAHTATDPVERARNSGRADARRTTSLVLLGAGATAMVTGGVFVYFDLKRAGRRNDATVAFGCGAFGCALDASGKF